MTRRKVLSSIVVLGFVVAIAATWASRRTEAILVIGINPQKVHFGPLALSRNDALRLYLAHVTMASEYLPCVADVEIFNQMGKMVGDPKMLMAEDGQTSFFDVFFNMIGEPNARRAVLRATMDVTAPMPRDDQMMTECIVTGEVYDVNTGKVQALLGGPDTMPAQ